MDASGLEYQARQRSWYDGGHHLRATLSQQFARAARLHPHTRAVFVGEGHVVEANLATIDGRARLVAAGLRRIGLRAGDRIAVQVVNCLEGLITVQAALHLGAVVVPVVHIYEASELGFVLRQSGAHTLVVPDRWRTIDFLARLADLGEVPSLESVVVIGDEPPPGTTPWASFERADSCAPPDPHGPDDVCVILYTSGTTSEPKGVAHTHNTLGAQIRTSAARLGITQDTVSLAAFPAGHMAGLLSHLRFALTGCSTVWMDRWDPGVAAGLIETYGVSNTSGAPTHLLSLLDAAGETGADLSTVRSYLVGAASVPPSLVGRADAAGIAAFRSYGSTEHPTLSIGAPADPVSLRATTDGRLVPGSEARIVDSDGVDVPAGEDGELVCRGPQQFIGYTDPALDEHSFLPGRWFRTGDIARLDGGVLTITDRLKDVIIRGGETMSSKAIEDVLASLPAVSEAAVVGAPHDRLGETVCAFVVPVPGASLDLPTVAAHFRSSGAARQKTPERLILVSDLPRTPSGKVRKVELRARLRRGVGAPSDRVRPQP